MKVNEEKERIFSYACALDQSGRQKNIITGYENTIYVINADKTILLRFEVNDTLPLKHPITFFANDYDSPDFNINNERIVFIQKGEEWVRSKICKAPNIAFFDIDAMFFKFYGEGIDDFPFFFTFPKLETELLDTNLSHMEFVVGNGEVSILQRDIFSGTIIELKKKKRGEGLGIVVHKDSLPEGTLPTIGMRTNDFLGMFYFNDRIKIHVPEEKGYFFIQGEHNSMLGIVAGCLYDDIGVIRNLQEDEDGWKEQEKRDGIKEVNRENKGKVLRKKC